MALKSADLGFGTYDMEEATPEASRGTSPLASADLGFGTFEMAPAAAPLSTVKKEPAFGSPEYYQNEFLKAKKQREERFQDVINVIQQTRDKLMAKPTEQTKEQYLRGFLQSLRQARETPLPGGGYARQTPYRALETLADYSSGSREAQKQAKEAKEAELLKLDELTKKYMYGEAKGAEDQAMQELKLFGTTKAKRVSPELQKVLDALDIVNSDAPADAKAAAQRVIDDSKTKKGDSSSLGQFYRALEESQSPDPKIAARGRQGLAFLRRGSGKGGGLTRAQMVHDAEVDRARAFVNNVDPKELDLAMRIGAMGNTRQQELVKNYWMSKKKKYSEVGGAGPVAGAPIDEEMPDETDGEE